MRAKQLADLLKLATDDGVMSALIIQPYIGGGYLITLNCDDGSVFQAVTDKNDYIEGCYGRTEEQETLWNIDGVLKFGKPA